MRNSTSGIYVVIAELTQAMDIPEGQRRKDHFVSGFYTYVGSALNGLEKRLARHLGKRKSLHWHIDYLLHEASVRGIIYAQTNQKLECLIAYSLFRKLAAKPNFGCSDCRCTSHLFYHQDLEILNGAVSDSFSSLGLNPTRLKIFTDLGIHLKQ